MGARREHRASSHPPAPPVSGAGAKWHDGDRADRLRRPGGVPRPQPRFRPRSRARSPRRCSGCCPARSWCSFPTAFSYLPHGTYSPRPSSHSPARAGARSSSTRRRGRSRCDATGGRAAPAHVGRPARSGHAGGRDVLRRHAVPLPLARRALARHRARHAIALPRARHARACDLPPRGERAPRRRRGLRDEGVRGAARRRRRLHAGARRRSPPRHALFVGGGDPHKNLDLALAVLGAPRRGRLAAAGRRRRRGRRPPPAAAADGRDRPGRPPPRRRRARRALPRGARPAWCRRATRGSACRRSRRWRAAVRWSRRAPAPCRRCAATRRCCSIPTTPGRGAMR